MELTRNGGTLNSADLDSWGWDLSYAILDNLMMQRCQRGATKLKE